MNEQPGEDLAFLTNVHEDERVLGDMVALICNVFRCDMWEANGKNRSEAEDLIMVEVEAKLVNGEGLTSIANALTYGKCLKFSRTGM
jgi:hypothetical protein